MTVEYLDLVDYLAIAAEVTGSVDRAPDLHRDQRLVVALIPERGRRRASGAGDRFGEWREAEFADWLRERLVLHASNA